MKITDGTGQTKLSGKLMTVKDENDSFEVLACTHLRVKPHATMPLTEAEIAAKAAEDEAARLAAEEAARKAAEEAAAAAEAAKKAAGKSGKKLKIHDDNANIVIEEFPCGVSMGIVLTTQLICNNTAAFDSANQGPKHK
eukprot:scaffold161859_cov26-Prasinocladus_malaysianus.AAC.1